MSVTGKGLEGVVVDQTSISKVISEKSSLIYRGYPVSELVQKCTYEQVVCLIWDGELPDEKRLKEFQTQERQARDLSLCQYIIDILKEIKDSHPMDALRTAVSLIGNNKSNTWDQDSKDIQTKGLNILAKVPCFIAAHNRFKNNKEFIPPREDLSIAENFLYMYFGKVPATPIAKAMDRSLILYAEHGFNASTFTTRVISSTTSDIHSAICGGIGSLKGPLHGGANEQVMYMMKEIGSVDKVEAYLDKALSEKRKIMGFGHRVYKKGDSRVPSMYESLKELSHYKKDNQWIEMYDKIASYIQTQKGILPNVDFPAGPVYYLIGLDIDVYTPIFVMSRVAGWTAHIIEQKENNRIIRPMSEYVGSKERHL